MNRETNQRTVAASGMAQKPTMALPRAARHFR